VVASRRGSKKRNREAPRAVVVRPRAREYQRAGGAARRDAADKKIVSTLSDMEAELARGELTGVKTYADVLRRIKIDRHTLFNTKYPQRAALVDGFLRKVGAAPRAKQPAKPKKQTFYERISVNAQEAEAVRLVKQREIDTLQSQLSAAHAQIAAFRAASSIVADRSKKVKSTAKRSVRTGSAFLGLGA
jgi:predicted DNA-binding protein (UPF0251 family)